MDSRKKRAFSVGDIARKEGVADNVQRDAPASRDGQIAPKEQGTQSAPPERATHRAASGPAPLSSLQPALVSGDDEDEPFDIGRYLGVLVRRRSLIIGVVILAALYSVYGYLTAPRYYAAKARLLFTPGYQDIVVDHQSAWRNWMNRERQMRTHLELLRSRAVLARLSENMEGAVTPGEVSARLDISRGTTDGQDNDIIELTFRHPRAEVAQNAVNELCRTYIAYRREVNAQEQTRLILKLETQIRKLRSDLNAREDEFRRFKEQHTMVRLSDETSIVVEQVSNMEAALRTTQLELAETKKRFQALQAGIGQQDVNVVQSMTYDNAYQNRLADLELQLSTLSAEYSPEHYRVRMLREQIDTLKKAMASDIESKFARSTTYVKNPIRQSLLQELAGLAVHRSALQTRRTSQEHLLEELTQKLEQLPSLEQAYVGYQRETSLLEETLRLLQKEYEQAKITRDSQDSDLRIFELALTPSALISKQKPSAIAIGALVGLLLGIALAFALEYLDQTVKDPAEIERLTEAHLLGHLPRIDTSERLICDADADQTRLVEPFRAVRANLKHILGRHDFGCFVVCSAVKGEGKTTVAANLATAFGKDGYRVVVVDCDLRRPQLHALFGADKTPGLAEVLKGTHELSHVLSDSGHPGVRLISSGSPSDVPSELLGTSRFASLIGELRSQADLVILDSPPLLPVSDLLTIAPYADGALLVARALWTPRKAVRQTVAQLRRIGVPLLGVVANGASIRGHGSYYYGYYAGRYSYESDEKHRGGFGGLESRLESAAVTWLRNIRLAVPRLVQSVGAGFRRGVRSPLLLVLALLLLALLVVERRLAQQTESAVDGISFVASDPLSSEAPAPYDLVPSEADLVAMESRALADTVRVWSDALVRQQTETLLRFYDMDRFTWRTGEDTVQGSVAVRRMLSEFAVDGIIVDDVGIAACAPSACTTYATIRFPSDSTAPSNLMLAWRRSHRTWRIVDQAWEHGSRP